MTREEVISLCRKVHTLWWGTYGLPPRLPIRWVRLVDCTSLHLKNILRTQHQITPEYRYSIHLILAYREYKERERHGRELSNSGIRE